MIKIVLPAYNEEETILPLIMDIMRILGERFKAFEVIVVNDGSTDNTAKIVSELNLPIGIPTKSEKMPKKSSHS